MSALPASTAPSSPPAPQAGRTVSGECPITTPRDEPSATRMSEKFRVPAEALPSAPPPARTDDDDAPPSGKATTRMAVPESLRLLRAALPTPESFEPLAIPAAMPFVANAAPLDERPLPLEHRRGRREIASAVGLFVLLVGASAAMAQLMGVLLFR